MKTLYFFAPGFKTALQKQSIANATATATATSGLGGMWQIRFIIKKRPL
jgi:hypothetical protein